MDYNWLGDHDPITIDANLAEIDFDDFKNEDLQNAYAYSLQSYVSPILFRMIRGRIIIRLKAASNNKRMSNLP